MSKYSVIDWRMRPPFGSFANNQIWTDENLKKSPTYPESARQFSMDLLMKEMDKSNALGVVPFRKGQDAVQAEEMIALNEQYPERFKFMAHIDPYADDPVADIDRLIVNGPADLAIIEPGQYFLKKPLPADDPLLYPIYEKMQAEKLPLTIVFGGLYTNELALYNPVFIDNISTMFPDLTMVLTHGAWPYVTEICHICYRKPNVYLSTDDKLDVIHPGYQDYVTAANNVLKERIIFGTCYPEYTCEHMINQYIKAGVSEEALPYVLVKNAERVLGI